jgi:hypothetical protein
MKKIQYSLCLLLLVVFTKAQNFEKDMAQVYKNFVNAPKIAYDISYVLKENHSATSKIISQITGRYVKLNDKCISQYDAKYTLTNATEIIMVDKEEKNIRVKKQNPKKPIANTDFLTQLKEYNKAIESVSALPGAKKETIVYTVQLKKNGIYPVTKYDITINTKTYYMEQISLFYNRPLDKDLDNNITGSEIPRLDILFLNVNAAKLYKTDELETAYYYSKQAKAISPSSNFTGYNIKEIL